MKVHYSSLMPMTYVWHRYYIDCNYLQKDKDKVIFYCVKDSLKDVNEDICDDEDVSNIVFTPSSKDLFVQEEQCKKWLNKKYPEWENANAYWE